MMTEKEFNHIILPLTKNIYSFALNMIGNAADAADITQDTMVKLWEGRDKWKKVENPKAWALKMVRNLCLDWMKKKKPVYDEQEVICNGGYDTDLLTRMEEKNTAEAVRLIINTLPDNQREVMILRELEELEYDEISRITGLGLNNIRVLLSRGRSKVKEILVGKYQISRYEG
ncbi:MAG: RNA polymerase sigma factor [Odoribacter sp.]